MVLAMKRLRLARAERFAEGLAQALAAECPRNVQAGLERARIKAIQEGNFDRADALRHMQLRLGITSYSHGKSTAAELEPIIGELQERVRRLENGRGDADQSATSSP